MPQGLLDSIFFSWVYDDLVVPFQKQPSSFDPTEKPSLNIGDPSQAQHARCEKQFELIRQATIGQAVDQAISADEENPGTDMTLSRVAILLHKMVGWDVCLLSFLASCSLACDTLAVMVMKSIIQVFETMESGAKYSEMLGWSFFFIVMHFLVKMVSHLSYHHLDFVHFRYQRHSLQCFVELFLKKISRMSFIQKQKINFGTVSTIIDSDIWTIVSTKDDLKEFHSHLAFTLINLVAMVNIVGCKSTFFGMVFLIGTTPIYYHFIKKREKKEKEERDLKEVKSNILSQFVQSIKLIKVYTLETLFGNKFRKVQEDIRTVGTQSNTYNFIIDILYYMQSFLLSSICFFIHCVIDGEPLTLSAALAIVELSECLKWPLYSLTTDIQGLFSKRLAISRIGAILNSPEHAPHTKHFETDSDKIIEMKNVYTNWTNEKEGSILSGINFTVSKGQHVAVIGKVGSGKSTLIHGILNESNLVSGEIVTKKDLSVSFVSQNPWVRNATIRDNILFGSEHIDEERFEQALVASDLQTDVQDMKEKENQMVGERGINLSGGQKARLALARALYHDADLYIFDDIFSAVDIHTAERILNHILVGPNAMLKGKTVIVSTHQLHFLQHVDRVVVMDKGEISEDGSLSELMENLNNMPSSHESVFKDLISSTTNISNEGVFSKIDESSTPEVENAEEEEEEEEETSESTNANTTEKSRLALIIQFLLSLGTRSYLLLTAVVLLGGLEVISNIVQDTTLSNWTLDEKFEKHSLTYYMSLYNVQGAFQMLGITLSKAVCGILLYLLGNKAQELLVSKLSQSKMRLYEDVPSGKIIKQFELVDDIRDDISWHMYDFIFTAWDGIICIALVLYAFPPSILLILLIVPATNYYRNIHTSISEHIKMRQKEIHDPTMTISNEIMDGLDTIRAFGSEKFNHLIQQISDEKKPNIGLDYCIEVIWIWFYSRNALLREMACVLGLCGIVLYQTWDTTASESIPSITATPSEQPIITPMHVAISLFYRRLNELIESSGRLITTYTKATNSFSCVDKLQHFINAIETERYGDSEQYKEEPTEGGIVFHNVSMRYRPENDLVLKNVSFSIKPGMKCAIIGRTASGKSSLLNCLLRFQEIESNGVIYMDGVDIREVPLKNLRKRVSYIPQQPTLFMGTLRENLDFDSTNKDEDILRALEQVGLSQLLIHKITKQEEHSDTVDKATDMNQRILDFKITENATNFSQGEKQLICLARCIIKKSKIILMDEATSNIDNYTDSQIQQTLRGPSFENCTIITIAHRIETVKDYDKMILMAQGQVLMEEQPELVLSRFQSSVQ